jgi:cysteinyl-tRNA synthetase, unknown class
MGIASFKIKIVLLFLIINFFFSIEKTEAAITKDIIDYRKEMRSLVMLISSRAKETRPGFLIIPQNAMDLIAIAPDDPKADIIQSYLSAIDGTGCEELYYGHSGDGQRTLPDTTNYFLNYLNIIKSHGKSVLVIDYVKNQKQANDSFLSSKKHGFISFQASRALKKIPSWIFDKNNNDINKLSEAKNFLYVLDASVFKSHEAYINGLRKTEHDLLVIDAFFWEKVLSHQEVNLLQKKPSGKKRLVLAYLSIGEAEEYRYYWKPEWKRNGPSFLELENPEWKGNYKVKYWTDEWKEIICGRPDGRGFSGSYLKKIIDAGFDGVYMDVLDSAYYFEQKNK